MSYVNHDFAMRLARRFLGSKGIQIRGIYMMWVEDNKKGMEFW